MKFKRNITVKIGCIISEFLVSCIPAILLITIFFAKSDFNEIISALLIIPYFGIIINFILILISSINALFDKTFYKVCDDSLIVSNKGRSFEISYLEITSITFDLGTLDKFNAQKAQLIIWGNNFKQLLVVKNPSLIMIHILKIKSQAPITYLNQKRISFILGLTNSIVLLFAILIKLL